MQYERIVGLVLASAACTPKPASDDEVGESTSDTTSDTTGDTTDTGDPDPDPDPDGDGWIFTPGFVGTTTLVFAEGDRIVAHDAYSLIGFDGQQWREWAPGGVITQVWARDIDDVYIATLDSTPAFDSDWIEPIPTYGTPGRLWHFDGEQFEVVLSPASLADKDSYNRNGFTGVTGSPTGEAMWAIESGRTEDNVVSSSPSWVFADGEWSLTAEPIDLGKAGLAYGNDTAWAASSGISDGDYGRLARWTGEAWTYTAVNGKPPWVDGARVWMFSPGILDSASRVRRLIGTWAEQYANVIADPGVPVEEDSRYDGQIHGWPGSAPWIFLASNYAEPEIHQLGDNLAPIASLATRPNTRLLATGPDELLVAGGESGHVFIERITGPATATPTVTLLHERKRLACNQHYFGFGDVLVGTDSDALRRRDARGLWQEKPVPQGASIWLSGPDEGWIYANGLQRLVADELIDHDEPLLAVGEQVVGLWGFAPAEIMLATSDGATSRMHYFDGTSWSDRTPEPLPATAIHAFFGQGDAAFIGVGPGFSRYTNVNGWEELGEVPVAGGVAWPVDEDQFWYRYLDMNGEQVLLTWSAGEWLDAESTWPELGDLATIEAIAGSAPDDVWMFADARLRHFDGTGWTDVELPLAPGLELGESKTMFASADELVIDDCVRLWSRPSDG